MLVFLFKGVLHAFTDAQILQGLGIVSGIWIIVNLICGHRSRRAILAELRTLVEAMMFIAAELWTLSSGSAYFVIQRQSPLDWALRHTIWMVRYALAVAPRRRLELIAE